MVRCRARRISSSSRGNPREVLSGLEIDDRLSLGLVLGCEDVQHGLGNDAWRSLRGLLGEQLNSGLRDGDGTGRLAWGPSAPKAVTGPFTFCKEVGLTGAMPNR